MKRRFFTQWPTLVVVGFSALLWPSNARATSCSFTSVIGVNFGSYEVFATGANDSTGSITLYCSGVQPTDSFIIELGGGSSGSVADRQMVSGSLVLGYNLYLDATRTVIWGNGTNGTSSLGPLSIADQTPTTWTVYGRIPALQNVSAGSYSDTIVVTVQF